MANDVSKEVKQATDAAKEGVKEVKKEVKDLKVEQKELLGNIKKSTQGYEELKKAVLSYTGQSSKHINYFLVQNAEPLRRLVATMQKITRIFERQAAREA